jgi:hypothetical protein
VEQNVRPPWIAHDSDDEDEADDDSAGEADGWTPSEAKESGWADAPRAAAGPEQAGPGQARPSGEAATEIVEVHGSAIDEFLGRMEARGQAAIS